MKKERQMEQQHNSYSAADNSQVSPTCPKPIVRRSFLVVSDEWDLDWGRKKLDECILFQSDDLDECKKYAQLNKLHKNRVVKSNGRIAEGDWYGAYDGDLGWEYD